MSDSIKRSPTHVELNYEDDGATINATYRVSEQTWHCAQSWQAQTPGATAWDLFDRLDNHGCKLDREDGPALIEHKPDDGLTYTAYYVDGKLHRTDGPAAISCFDDGSTREEHYVNGQLHREDGPAVIERFADGSSSEVYYVNGKRHRIGGPALIKHYANSSTDQQYYIDGKFVNDGRSTIRGLKIPDRKALRLKRLLKGSSRPPSQPPQEPGP
jgi:hypothetical protein